MHATHARVEIHEYPTSDFSKLLFLFPNKSDGILFLQAKFRGGNKLDNLLP